MPAAADVVEKSKATLVTADWNFAIDTGFREGGFAGDGGYAPKRSMTISTRTVEGPAAKKLTQVNAMQTRIAMYILKPCDLESKALR